MGSTREFEIGGLEPDELWWVAAGGADSEFQIPTQLSLVCSGSKARPSFTSSAIADVRRRDQTQADVSFSRLAGRCGVVEM